MVCGPLSVYAGGRVNVGTNQITANFLLFQAGWLVCVVGGATPWYWVGPVMVIAILALHLRQASWPLKELKLVAVALLVGTFWDSLLVAYEVLDYHYGTIGSRLAPAWIIAMWALFATTLNVSLRWLRGRWFIAAGLGALGGPLAYYAGTRLGAVTMPDQTQALLALAMGWALIMPLLLRLAQRFDGFFPERAYPAPAPR